MNIGKLIWGLIVIFIGLVFLLINYGILTPTIWASIWKLWPLVLIVGGLSIISKSLSFVGQIIINLIIIITLLAALTWVIVPNKFTSSNGEAFNQASSTQMIDEIPSDQSKSSNITIKTGAAKLNIDGNSDQLISGSIEGNFPASVNRTLESGQENIELVTSSRKMVMFNRIKNNWNLSIGKNLPTKLELNTGAIEGNLDLSEVNLTDLNISSGASSYDIRLGNKSDKMNGEFSIGASKIKLSVPESAGLRISSKSGASSNNFVSEGLKKSDEIYQTEDYDKASKKIEINLKAGASSIELDRY